MVLEGDGVGGRWIAVEVKGGDNNGGSSGNNRGSGSVEVVVAMVRAREEPKLRFSGVKIAKTYVQWGQNCRILKNFRQITIVLWD